MSGIDTDNQYAVGVAGPWIVVHQPPIGAIRKRDALVFAAWLVVLAEETPGEFNTLLEAVKNT